MTEAQKYYDYLKMLKTDYTKVCRARFLNPDGSTAFAVDNNSDFLRNKALLTDNGTLTCNLQNGQRRSMNLTFSQVTEDFDYNLNNVWFGTEIAWDEGLLLSDGAPYYIPQGIFVVKDPQETIVNNERSISYNLVDKWANLDGTLYGNLEATYTADMGVNIFAPIAALLSEDRGNGRPLDNVTPIFTSYYNGKYQELPDGRTFVALTSAPYSLVVEPGTKADVVLGFAKMLNAWVGYDETGALRIDPSQDDILDTTKPVQWEFSTDEAEIIGLTYDVKNTDVYNDIIVMGETTSDQKQSAARAQNLDPTSDTNVQTIGRKTLRLANTGLFTQQQCDDFALWKLKRTTILQKAVTVQCKQIMHIKLNQLITIERTDKPGSPTERHLVLGFSRPQNGTELMMLNCVSVNDFPIATLANNWWGNFASLAIRYPSGYLCTASSQNTTLTAPNTSGIWNCEIPFGGAWTITAKKTGETTRTTTTGVYTWGATVQVNLA